MTISVMIQPDVYHKGFCTRKKEIVKRQDIMQVFDVSTNINAGDKDNDQ
ncbi:putative prophage protein [Escherichia coli]|nr:putative prophage protein [Escherichia coli]